MNLFKKNELNRRVALRVFERANLCYQKIPHDQSYQATANQDCFSNNLASPQSEAIAVEQTFPYSQSQENDVLNVNLSSSGIAFNCIEKINPSEYLKLRILFLSSMTVLTTICKVVYCKPSNPYEYDRHPYSIGAQFVNLTAEDTEILNQHVSKRRQREFMVNGLIISCILTFLAMPEAALGLLLELCHHAVEITLHVLHLAFEFLEMVLDHFIEHHFHSDTHKTQVIVFYIIISIGIVVACFLGRKVWSVCKRKYRGFVLYLSRKKSSFYYFWSQQGAFDKIKLLGVGTTVIVGYFYFGL